MLQFLLTLKSFGKKILYIHVRESREKSRMETTTAPEMTDMKFLSKKDKRMRFNNAQDPIFYAFNVLDERSLVDLMRDFVNDTIFEVSNFVSKMKG